MPKLNLTSEQLQVIHHPIGEHARVLAVAGSGKSITLAYRIKHLIQDQRAPPGSIRVLMFNKLARKQFRKHLEQVGLPDVLQPEVHTFHSFSYKVIRKMTNSGVLPELLQFWIGDKKELILLTIKRAIANLEQEKRIPEGIVKPEAALSHISLWKSALLPPERAGCHTLPLMPLVYEEFERLRLEKCALTFDDFIPLAMELLEGNPYANHQWCHGVRHILVDEYQDINFGQQRLIEVLAGGKADVMVVGDDDQTIYEWRGARPDYIINNFTMVFDNKPVMDYTLSRSFRFGPGIAQPTAKLIAMNTHRVKKPLVAHQSTKHSFIQVYGGGFVATKELVEQVLALTRVDGTPPEEIIVLARLFAQLGSLEREFPIREIPYRVVGERPFFRRSEISTLLEYLRLARDLYMPVTRETRERLFRIVNQPPRLISVASLSHPMQQAMRKKHSLAEALTGFSVGANDRNDTALQSAISQGVDLLYKLSKRISKPGGEAGKVLSWLISEIDYLSCFQDYYGKGEHAEEKIQAILNFIEYASYARVSAIELLDLIDGLDTTRGVSKKEQIIFTTIFRTKGLEFDYVIIPDCNERVMPYLKGRNIEIYDKAGMYQEPPQTNKLEGERRLAYVAITRARKGVLIGTSSNPSRFIMEMYHEDVRVR